MDLSHCGRHLPGRLAVLVLRDGDKTPVSVLVGEGLAWDGRTGWADGFPETLRCSAINFPTHGLK